MRWTKARMRTLFFGVGIMVIIVGMNNPFQNSSISSEEKDLNTNLNSNTPRLSTPIVDPPQHISGGGIDPLEFRVHAETDPPWPLTQDIIELYYRLNYGAWHLCWEGHSESVTYQGYVDADVWLAIPPGSYSIEVIAYEEDGHTDQAASWFTKYLPAPTVSIDFPQPWQLCNTTAPSFSLTLSNYSPIDAIWYSLDNGLTNTNCGATGDFSAQWGNIFNGTVPVTFWIQDQWGRMASASTTIQKDVIAPVITSTFLTAFQVYGVLAPSFSLIIENGGNLDSTWYSLDNGITNTTCDLVDDLSAQWNICGNGTVPVTFWVNNTLGNTTSIQIILQKQIIAPIIIDTDLVPLQLCGTLVPYFSLTIVGGGSCISTWYSLDNGVTNTTCFPVGNLNTQWGTCGNGTVPVTFWVSDIFGNITSFDITIQKCVIPPVITDTGILSGQIFGPVAPSFSLTIINGGNLAATWYSLNNGLTNTTCDLAGDLAGQWNLCPNGPVTVTIWAMDAMGSSTSTSIIIQKQVIASGILVNAADLACGFGSSRCGVTLGVYVPGTDTWSVSVAIEEMQDLDGDGIAHERYSNITSVLVNGYASVKLILSILFCEEGQLGDGQSGIFYRYHIWVEDQDGYTVVEHYVNKVGLYHWSNWDGGNVTWDAISQYNAGGYSVYIKRAFWNQTTGLLYDNVDANSTVITTSAYIGQQPAAGEMALSLPSTGTMSTTGIEMAVFMSLYSSGWYYFTYIAPTDSADPWADRLGCPPELS